MSISIWCVSVRTASLVYDKRLSPKPFKPRRIGGGVSDCVLTVTVSYKKTLSKT